MSTGRPTVFTKNMIEKAEAYLNGGYKDMDQVIPSMIGLALHLNVGKSTLYNWMDQKDHPFVETLGKVSATQEMKLLNGGLSGDLNAAITKLALGNYGYSDKQETDINLKSVDLQGKTTEELLYFKEHGKFPVTTD